jgi:tetratricopeptide (TPR) repeat protein
MSKTSNKRTASSGGDVMPAVHAALAAGDTTRAVTLAQAALAQGVEAPLLLNLCAYSLELEGRLVEAMDLLDRAFRLAPADPTILNAIGRNYSKQGRADEALRAFDVAISVLPSYAPAHNGRGLALEMLGDPEGAWASQETASRLEPQYPDPLGALAALAVQRQDWTAVRAHAERALALDPYQSAATLSLATLEQHEGDTAAVVARLAPLLQQGGLAPLHEASAQRMLADALDTRGRAAEAFPAYAAANRLLRHAHQSTFGRDGVEGGVALTERLGAYFEAADPAAWAGAPGEPGKGPDVLGHVFLVGFPRSGTTLLEQVLASHPKIVALEERPTLGDVGAFFFTAEDLDRLADLDGPAADRLRADYWKRVAECGIDPAGKVFVDKLPLATLWLPYIAKLFPDAKVLFARRDPRDVVLSCFRRRFVVNGALYAFTELEDLSRFYAGTMGLAEVYREKLSLAWQVHRHEDLIEDFDAEAKSICAFLDVKWDKAMRDFAETAKRRDVRTPSASQVRRGLYREGMAQWRAYAEPMAPVLPILQPWVERFGYPAA